jgi:CRISPR-associated protein Cas1
MRPLLNTLYVTTDGSYLARQRETVCVRRNKQVVAQFPIHVLEGIVCFGKTGVSTKVLDLCARSGVPLSLLSPGGRFIGRVHGPTTGNVLLRRQQYRATDDPDAAAKVVRSLIIGKVSNCRTVILRAAREREQRDETTVELRRAAQNLADVLQRLSEAVPLDTARGYEGEAAAGYYGVFDHLIAAQKEGFTFKKRTRRPPLDPINALLSFLYTLLMNDVAGAVEAVGLDLAVGFLHRDRPGRLGLALDLMEELRPVLADRLALSMINRRQISPAGFRTTESGAVLMNDDTRKEILVAYQTRKQDTITHPFLDEEIHLGLVPHAQALLLARHLRGELDGYPPFLWK